MSFKKRKVIMMTDDEEYSLDPLCLLPIEVLDIIFTMLKPEDLARASRVSKSWMEYVNRDILWKGATPRLELLAPPYESQDLEGGVALNKYRVMCARRARSVRKWRLNQFWSQEHATKPNQTYYYNSQFMPRPQANRLGAIANGGIAVESTRNGISVYDLNDGNFRHLLTQEVPIKHGIVRSMKILSETVLALCLSDVLLIYKWTGTSLDYVDGIVGQKTPDWREVSGDWWLTTYDDSSADPTKKAHCVELEARLLVGTDYIVISTFVGEEVIAAIWSISERKVVGSIRDSLCMYSMYSNNGIIYICHVGVVLAFDPFGNEIGCLVSDIPERFDAGDIQIQFNPTTALVVTVDIGEVEAYITAWDTSKVYPVPPKNMREEELSILKSIGTPLHLKDSSLRILHPTLRATLIHDVPPTEAYKNKEAGVLCNIVATDIINGIKLWESPNPVTRPFWDDPHYLVSSRFLVFIDGNFDTQLNLIDLTNGEVYFHGFGSEIIKILNVFPKFVYCATNNCTNAFIVFT